MRRAGGAKFSFYADGNLEAGFKRFFANAEKKYDERADRLLVRLNELILARTPVWEGDTIHNWRWSTRAPDMRHENPIDNGAPGPTNRMELGAEPRRRVNETRARQSLAGALRAKEPIDIYLTNTAESAVALEYGLLPTRAQSRSKAGIVRISVKEVFG